MELGQCIEKRRSIRKFQKKEVAKELIREMIEAGIKAPSWKNSQVSRYYIVDTSERVKEFLPCLPVFNQDNVADAPVVIVSTVVKNRSGFERDGSYSTHLKDGWQYFDNGLQVQNICLKAYELGLGTIIMGIYDVDSVRKFFDIPETEEVVAVIGVGYPGIEPEVPKRKAFDDIVKFK